MYEDTVQILASLFNESKNVAKLMYRILTVQKDKISFKDILSFAENITGSRSTGKELTEETLLSMYWWRMLLPVRMKHMRSLSWDSRLFFPSENEFFEIPLCIKYVFEGLCSKGFWDYNYSPYKYFNQIKEPYKELIPTIIEGIVERVCFRYYVTATMIKEECLGNNFPSARIGVLISELKGGGFISPFVSSSLPKIFRLKEEPLYELNKALFILKLHTPNTN